MEPLPQSAAQLMSPWQPGVFALAVYTGAVIVMILVILFLTGRLGARREGPVKESPYESGIAPTGSARFLYPVPFYLVATFFLIFDVEAVYVFSWAVAFRGLGWAGWLQMSFFIIVLFVSLVYIWKKGGLDWGPEAHSEPGIQKPRF
ncbi:MAG: NADH-quinone oxidoreductase subunit A [Syntrophobacteraceae bacterium]